MSETFLLEQFRPELAEQLRVCVKFVWGDGEREQCQLTIEQGIVRISADSRMDLTLNFESDRLLRSILLGEESALDHFLTGAFRADGGLPLVFPILQAFAGRSPGLQSQPP